MSGKTVDKKAAAIKAIKFNIKLYNLTALLVVFTLMLIILNSVTSLVEYIPRYSIVVLLAIVSILVVINFYLSKKVSSDAIQNMEEYEENVHSLLTAMEREMDSQKSTHEDLKAMSLHDDLTGLHNKQGFMPIAEQYLKTLDRQNSIAYILYADIDNMKYITDSSGYHEGDEVIKIVSDILRDVYSGSDILARIGDDEFAVLPVGFTASGVELINRHLKEKIDKFNSVSDKNYDISFSYGVAEYNPASPCSIEELLERSKKMMHEEKKRKRTP